MSERILYGIMNRMGMWQRRRHLPVSGPTARTCVGVRSVSERLEKLEGVEIPRVLVDNGIPIGVVAELADNDALLAADPKLVSETLCVLRDVWPNPTRLVSTIQEFPFVLSDDSWLARLPRSTTELTDFGWSGAEAAKIIVDRPDVVYLRKFELNNTIKALARIMGENDTDTAMKFFAKNPAVLLEFRERFVPKVDQIVEALGLTTEEVTRIFVDHDAVFKANVDVMKNAMSLVKDFCRGDEEMARAIVLKAPQILAMTTARVQDSVRVLRSLVHLGIEPKDVASYPSVFVRHPYRVVGPRIQYIKERSKKDVRLATYLSCSDRTFEAKYVKSDHDAWNAITFEWERRGKAATESRGAVSQTETQQMTRRTRPEAGQNGVAKEKTPQATTASPQNTKPPQSKSQQPVQRKRNRFLRKRLTRLPQPDSDQRKTSNEGMKE